MVATEFVNLFTTHVLNQRAGVEDFSDRLCSLTFVWFLVAWTIVTVKTYFFNAISCYIPVSPSGVNYKDFLSDYCWVHGTIPLGSMEKMPDSPEQWFDYDMHRRITYYQWIPFILGLQGVFFYLPHFIWMFVCLPRAGGDLYTVMKVSADSATLDRDARGETVKRVVAFLEDMFKAHGDIRRGRRRNFTRAAYSRCGFCVPSKRMGTCILFCYLMVKLLIISNAFGQLFMIQRFLSFDSEGTAGLKSSQLAMVDQNGHGDASAQDNSGLGFGLSVFSHLVNGRDWRSTLLFPRVAYCHVPGLQLVGVKTAYTAQCTLPINMLNEKIYIFFWFWIILMICFSSASLLLWLYRFLPFSQRMGFIKIYLDVHGGEDGDNDEEVKKFVDWYLRIDGVFVLRMLAINAGDIITMDIVKELFDNWKDRQESIPQLSKEPLINKV